MRPTHKLHYRTMSDGQSRKVFTVDADGQQHLLAIARFDASSGRFAPEWPDEAPDNQAEVAAYIDGMTRRQRRKPRDEAAPVTDKAGHDTQEHSPCAVDAQPDAVEVNNTPEANDSADALPVQTALPMLNDVSETEETVPEPQEEKGTPEDNPEPAAQVPHEKLVIFCEGETECGYLNGFVTYLGIANRVDVRTHAIKEPGAAFKQIASQMLWDRQVGTAEWSEVWLVFDRDGHAGYHEAFELVEHFPFIHLAFTNPCFEYWLLLHERRFDGVLPKDYEIVRKKTVETTMVSEGLKRIVTEELVELTTRPEDCLDILKRLEPKFKKGDRPHFDAFGPKLALAYTRGKVGGKPEVGQGTGLPDLIDRLCEIAGRAPQDVMADLKAPVAVTPDDPSGPPLAALKTVSDLAAMYLTEKSLEGVSQAQYEQVKDDVADIMAWLSDTTPNCQTISPGKENFVEQLQHVVNLSTAIRNPTVMTNNPPNVKSLRKLYRALISMTLWLNTWERTTNGEDAEMIPTETDPFEEDVPF